MTLFLFTQGEKGVLVSKYLVSMTNQYSMTQSFLFVCLFVFLFTILLFLKLSLLFPGHLMLRSKVS